MLTYYCGEYQPKRRKRRTLVVAVMIALAVFALILIGGWMKTVWAVPICEAHASSPTLREGSQVACSMDLSGNMRTTGGGGGSVTVADGADTAEGATTDAAVTSDVAGSVSAKLRGLVKILADVWDSVNHRLNVAVQNFPTGFNINNSPTVNQGTANATPWNQNVAQVGGIAVSATAKGVQGSNFVPTQRPFDGGRTSVTLYVDAITAVTTEALATLTQNFGGTVTTGTSYTVTSGKTLRLIGGGIQVGNQSTTPCVIRIRIRAAATVSVSSPIYLPAGVIASSGVQASGSGDSLSLADGMEFAGGTQVGISYVANSTSCTTSFMVVGYEY